MQNELIRTAPLASQEKLRAGNRNRKIAIKHRLKKYLDDILPSKKLRKAGITTFSDPLPAYPMPTAKGVDVPMAQPLPN